MKRPDVLTVEQLRVAFGGVCALDIERLAIPAVTGTGALLMGTNGAGKTTFLDALSGFVRPASGGAMTLFAEHPLDIIRLSRVQKVHAGVARTFQHPPAFQSLTVRESLALVTPPTHRLHGLKRGETSTIVDALVDVLDVSTLLGAGAAHLSVAALRRVELVRALSTEPRLLVLDEPTAGSDDRERERLADFLSVTLPRLVEQLHASGLYRFANCTSCVVTHDLRFAARLSEMQSPAPIVHVLDQGALRASGTLGDLTQVDELRSSYFGGL